MEDVEFIAKIAKGDSKAFESLLKKHQRAVFGLSLKLLRTSELAEENAQETWIRVVKAAESYSPQATVLTWILTIAKNLALNVIEKRGWEEELDLEMENQIPAPSEDFIFQQEQDANLIKLKCALGKLPERQRVILVLWMLEEKSYSELAIELKLKINAVKALLFRAKKNIVKLMKEAET